MVLCLKAINVNPILINNKIVLIGITSLEGLTNLLKELNMYVTNFQANENILSKDV